jgi:FMN phosphatase YigB (HAD superfamily)
MKTTAPVKGIIFDLDGTLYHMKWFLKPFITLRLFPHSLRLPLYMSIRDTFAGKDMGSGEALMESLSNALSQKVRGSSPDEMRRWIYDGFYRQFEAALSMMRGSRPGLSATVNKLRKKNIKLAVLSDYDRVEERLQRLDIDSRPFDILKTTEKSGSLKPSPRPFIEIAEKWGFKPQSILVIGDRHDTDGAAAASAGMQFLQITNQKMASDGKKKWHEIVEFLEKLPSLT